MAEALTGARETRSARCRNRRLRHPGGRYAPRIWVIPGTGPGWTPAQARELATAGLTADLAVARGDWHTVYTESEKLIELQRRWAVLYRRLLVIRIERRS